MRLYLASRVSTVPDLCTKNETMAPLHVATLTVKKESYLNMRLYLASRVSTVPDLCTKNETMAPLQVATPRVQKVYIHNGEHYHIWKLKALQSHATMPYCSINRIINIEVAFICSYLCELHRYGQPSPSPSPGPSPSPSPSPVWDCH